MNNKFDKLTQTMAQSVTRGKAFKQVGVGLASIALLVAGTLCVTGFGQKYHRLGGGWVGGNSTYTWSVLFAPSDPLGRLVLDAIDGSRTLDGVTEIVAGQVGGSGFSRRDLREAVRRCLADLHPAVRQ